ncbi:hypothetical protein TYRP_013262 [Tyrophagus putrescentiae]|nr:hypothetical protein TYRP_013262 [Tyrophagus putrescentiae]
MFGAAGSFAAVALLAKTTTTTESTNLNRLNTKNLNRLFKRHFSAVGVVSPTAHLQVPVPQQPPTTTESAVNFGDFYPEILELKKKKKKGSVEYRRSDDYQQQQQQQIISQEGFAVSATSSAEQNRPLYSSSLKPSALAAAKPVQLFQEIKVSLSGPSLPLPTNQSNLTLLKPAKSNHQLQQRKRLFKVLLHTSGRFHLLFQLALLLLTFRFDDGEQRRVRSLFVTRPSDQCRCVCRHGHRLESYDIELEELRAKLLQAELLSESKASSSNRVKHKVEDVLDSLVDEDENDYDDIDELEAIQKPTKYIPMEIIELSHRRPPSKGPSSPPATSSSSSSSSSSTSGRIPFSPSFSPSTTTTSSPSLAASSSSPSTTAIAAPAYSVSFAKPAITLKAFATRVVQLGIPLLVTVALGNALTQFELTDRSLAHSDHLHPQEEGHRRIGDLPLAYASSGNYTPFFPYWNSFLGGVSPWGETMQHLQVPLAAGTGFYAPFYEALDEQQTQQQSSGADNGRREPEQVAKRRRIATTKTKTASRKQSTTSERSFWRRWYDRLQAN